MLGMAITTITGTLKTPTAYIVRQSSPAGTWHGVTFGPAHINGNIQTLAWSGPVSAAAAAIAAAGAKPLFP